MRQGDVVHFLHSDHLGSTSLTTNQAGGVVAQSRYLPYGQTHWLTGTLTTDFQYTSQRQEMGFGLYDYNARYYDAYLNRFVSPDSIVPNPTNPQSLNRYSYGYNNPVKFTDSTGHFPCEGASGCNEPPSPPPPEADEGWDRTVSYDPHYPYNMYLDGKARYEYYIANPDAYVSDSLSSSIGADYGLGMAGSYAEYAKGENLESIIDSRLEGGLAQSILPGNSIDILGAGGGALGEFGGGGAAVVIIRWKSKGGKLSQVVDGAKMSTNDALDAAVDYLGRNYREVGGGRFLSVDGTRQVRMGEGDILGTHGGGPHLNFEELVPNPVKPGKVTLNKNVHIYLTD